MPFALPDTILDPVDRGEIVVSLDLVQGILIEIARWCHLPVAQCPARAGVHRHAALTIIPRARVMARRASGNQALVNVEDGQQERYRWWWWVVERVLAACSRDVLM